MKDLIHYMEHLDSESRIIAKRMIDLIENAIGDNQVKASDFLSQQELLIAQSILNYFKYTSYYITGISKNALRQAIIIFPFEMDASPIIPDFFSVIHFDVTGETLNHRDVLGSIMSLGINRSKIGDIFVYENEVFVILKREILLYITSNLEKIGNRSVKVREIDIMQSQTLDYQYKKIKVIVSSLRVDSITAALAHISRGKSIHMIESGDLKLNGKQSYEKNTLLKEGDIFSIRKIGKFKLVEVSGVTKKNNSIVEILQFI
jgi:RNA-binding protein YlmH